MRATSPSAASELAPDQDPKERRASVFVVHHAPDFSAYLEQFARNEEARSKAGVTRAIVLRLSDDPTRVGVHFSAGSRQSVDAFLKSADFDRLVESNEATDSTLLWVAVDELDELPATVSAGSASLFKKFPVRDVECVVTGLISSQSQLQEQGLLGFSLHRTESDGQTVILHLVATDPAKAEQVYGGEVLSSLLKSCGAEKLEKPVIGINQKLF